MWVFARSHFDSGGKVGFGSIWRERGAPALALAWLTLSMQFGGRMQKKRFVETLQANGVCSDACWYLDMSGKLRYFSSYYSLALLMRFSFIHLLSLAFQVILQHTSLLALPPIHHESYHRLLMSTTASPSSPCRSSSG